MKKQKVVDYLKKNPKDLETHKVVLNTLKDGISGDRLVRDFRDVLHKIHPPLLEGWYNNLPYQKRTRIRAATVNRRAQVGSGYYYSNSATIRNDAALKGLRAKLGF
jgi:hypothetical protein